MMRRVARDLCSRESAGQYEEESSDRHRASAAARNQSPQQLWRCSSPNAFQVGHGRRLNSCFCRKAFKEIGRESNSTDDDDDAAVEAPVKKKEALPAFALDFGNGA